MLALQLVLVWVGVPSTTPRNSGEPSKINYNPETSKKPSSAALQLLVELIGLVGDWSRHNTAGNSSKLTQVSQYCQDYKQQSR